MNSRRWIFGAVAVVLIVLAAFVYRVDPRGAVSTSSRVQAPVVTAMPRPSPTPPPWFGSVVAAVVPMAAGQTIVLVEVGATEAPRQLVDAFDEIGRLAWSPDGGHVAFAARREANWDVFSIARDGTDLTRLTTHPGYDNWPTWSPDGRQIAFSSNREGNLDIHVLDVRDGIPNDGTASVRRLTDHTDPAIEPAWSPDGTTIAYAAWHDGWYRVKTVTSMGEEVGVLAHGEEGSDQRSPTWTLDGEGVVFVDRRYGPGRLSSIPSGADEPGVGGGDFGTIPAWRTASRVSAFSWYPGGGAMLTAVDEREGRALEVWDAAARGRQRVAVLPAGTGDVSWSIGPMPTGLADASQTVAPSTTATREPRRPIVTELSGLVRVADVDVPGDRIHADLAEDFADMRAEVRASVGTDFLGTLADLWRPLGYSGSSFFSWHKMGRAFDTQMELRGPGGRRDTVLVREEVRGRTFWRMFLRAAVQDGSIGQPLVEAGWAFTAGGGDPAHAAEGGRRGTSVPGGYWVDFTAIAGRYGWHRIPSVTHGRLDWRSSWTGIDYWHYERRDGLRWFEAARQVYPADELDAELRAERLREHGVSFWRLSRLGFPSDWLSGG